MGDRTDDQMDARAIALVGNAYGLLQTGKASGDKSQIQRARDKVERALRLPGGDTLKGVHAIHGEIMAEMHEFDEALGAFAKALEADPQDSETLYRAAMAHCHLGGDKEQTRMLVLAAILVSPRKPLFWITLARMYDAARNHAAAVVCVEITDQLRPGLPVVEQARASGGQELRRCNKVLSLIRESEHRIYEVVHPAPLEGDVGAWWSRLCPPKQ